MNRIDLLNRIVTVVALIALAVVLWAWLSKPTLTAAPQAGTGPTPTDVPRTAPAAPMPVRGPALPIDQPSRNEETVDIKVEAVVAPPLKAAEPAPVNACRRQYYPCHRGLFRRR